jgi:hypothetical protein
MPDQRPPPSPCAPRPAAAQPARPPQPPPRPAGPQPQAPARLADAPGGIANRDQDPNHPANKTLSPERLPTQRSAAEGFNIPPADLLTEQEKDAAAGGAATDGNVPGVGPAEASEESPGPVETIEDQGIGPRTPYPDGDPPPPAELTTVSHGIKGKTDKPKVEPNKQKEPVK